MATSSTGKGISEIPVMVEGFQKWVTGLTPKTTCDDVIHSLLLNMDYPSPHDAVSNYALFENLKGVERPLKGRSKLVKLCKEWGTDARDVILTMRRINPTVKSDVCGSVTKAKLKAKNFFKFKNSSKKTLFSATTVEDTTNMLEDSSIMMQNKENNLLCAFNCYSSKKRPSQNMRAPFEKPQTVTRSRPVTVCNPAFVEDTNSIYSREHYVSNQSSNQYASLNSVKRSSVYGSSASLRKVYGSSASLNKRDSAVIYGSSASVRSTATYGSTSSLRNTHKNEEPLYSVAREPMDHHHYEYPKNHKESDYGYTHHIDYHAEPACDNPPSTDTRLKSLLNMVLSQERRIQEQFGRIKEADERIDSYEIRMHNIRSQSHGKDYLQDTYLNNVESLLNSDITDEDIEKYEGLVENIASVDEQLLKQCHKLEELSSLLHSETQQMDETFNGPFESTRVIDPAIQKQIDELRAQLQETVKVSIQREKEIQELDNCFQNFNEQLNEKKEIIAKLTEEINAVKEPSIQQESSPVNHAALTEELRETENALRTIFSSVSTEPKPVTVSVEDNSVVSDCESMCNVTDDVKQQSLLSQKSPVGVTLLPPIGFETMAKMFSSRLMPDLALSEPSVNITTDLNDTTASGFDETSVWNTQDDGIDVTYEIQEEDTYCISVNTLLDGTTINKSNTLLESTVNIECDSPATVRPPRPVITSLQLQNQKCSVKKKLFFDYNTDLVDREIKDVMSTITGDVSRLSESSESGVGSLHSDDSTGDISGDSSWGRIETTV